MPWRVCMILLVTSILASCGPGQPTYLDRVRSLPLESAHPFVQELLPLLLETPSTRSPDDLVRTWKEFLGETMTPLRKDQTETFVYYDFTNTLKKVYLEASFAPGRPEPLTKLGTTPLFYGVYEVPKVDRLRYRYSDGTNPLADPFNPRIERLGELWHQVSEPPGEAALHWVVGSSEGPLAGQDLLVVIPPGYQSNLAWTYPVLVVVGQDGDGWTTTLTQLMKENAIRPVLAVSVGTKSGGPWPPAPLKSVLEERVVPWVKDHYRASPLVAEWTLLGTGESSKVTQELAAARPDFWTRVAHNLDVTFLRSQFAVVNP